MKKESESRITAEQLQQPGFVEDLVRSGRLPHLAKGGLGEDYCWIPPVGTQSGDTQLWLPGIGFSYRSPSGESRGNTEFVTIDKNLTQDLGKRIKTTLVEMGLMQPRKTIWQKLRSWRLP